MFVTLILTMGLVFEMPVLAHVLSRFGIITRQFLRKYRRHAIIAVLILSAVITPSADAFTMIMVAIPLYLLYEFSILVCKKS
jgi:sec-independent protein translocase protein TatC